MEQRQTRKSLGMLFLCFSLEKRDLRAVQKELQREWDTSTPEWLGKVPAKFLGMEISEHEKGFLTSQAAYIQDKTSLKDMYPPPEDQVDEKDVRLAQKDIYEDEARAGFRGISMQCHGSFSAEVGAGDVQVEVYSGAWPLVYSRPWCGRCRCGVVWRWRASGLF